MPARGVGQILVAGTSPRLSLVVPRLVLGGWGLLPVVPSLTTNKWTLALSPIFQLST